MYHRSLTSMLVACISVVIIASCACTQGRTVPPTDAERVPAPEPVITAYPVSKVPTHQDAEAPVTRDDRCPGDMVPVTGTYCSVLEHKCIEGREKTYAPDPTDPKGKRQIETITPVHCPNGCATPYFCDKFVEGHAVCKGKETEKRFCIDDHEYPNRVGELPMVMVTWNEAKELCRARGKRLCGDDEWTLACEGQERRPYPYGWERDATACNIDHPQRNPGVNERALGSSDKAVRDAEVARLDQRVPIGTSPRCVSPYGAHDMAGNVDEWTVNVTRGGKPYVSLFKGGHWVGGARNRCRPATDAHGPEFAFYAEGFRCCRDMK